MIETGFGLGYHPLKMTYHYLIRICKHFKNSIINFQNIYLILILCFSFTGCSTLVEHNGVPIDNGMFQGLIIGSSTKNQVKKNLGEPLMIDNQSEETWIYFSQKIEKIAFFAPKLTERTVTLLKFKSNKLINKESFTQKDSKIIDINTKKVISGGRKLTVLQQIFGNVGNFSSQNFQQN